MENIRILVHGSNDLGINLHKALARNGGNVFFSPFSVSSVLTMLLHGIRGDAESELRKFLRYEGVSDDVLSIMFKNFIRLLKNSPDGYSISFANSVVIHKDFEVLEQYKADLKEVYVAHVVKAYFVCESEDVVDQMNEWVKETTRNTIPYLVDSLDTDTVMVLLNAVYFKGFWLKSFKENATFLQYFYNHGLEDSAKLVEMMHMNESFLWVEKESFKVLQLPYRGEEVAMLIFLPKSKEGLHEIEDMLTPDFMKEIQDEMHKRKIEVALPKFRLEHSSDYTTALQELGLRQIFKGGADFRGISGSKDLAVSQVVHKAVLAVSEEGLQVAPTTDGVVMRRCLELSPEFIVDYPFAFVIYNISNNLILFMGRVEEL